MLINVLKYRYVCFAYSFLLIAGFFVTYAFKSFNYSVEFAGGTQVMMRFSKAVTAEGLKKILEQNPEEFKNPDVRVFNAKSDSSEQDALIRIKSYSTDAEGLAERMRQLFEKESDGVKVSVLQTDSVGAGVGSSLWWNSLVAVIISLILMLIYIAFRFWSFGYALGAVLALFHDAIVILFFFLLFDYEISANVIGAILATLGYSINDTIVIFARIRENIAKMAGVDVETAVNIGINQTLRRTVLTSFATSLVVISLIIFGGETLRPMSIALMLGIVFGTYSSIYIASPVMLLVRGSGK
ncbi:MAG: Protein translocase subunit SecF [candidate division TM6 bacterium GW2011_GWF2_32_72]|nr:MAG: Protein translocase subunit SecF [candidate division TM6 bacterium GW2011_GWF2_32_72]